jgi:quercetin dioxygenase-like cupin family protein
MKVKLPAARLAALLVALGLAGVAAADSAPPVTVKTLLTTDKTDIGQPLVLPSRHPVLVVSTYDIVPGARLARHKHPFSRYAYVLAGDLTVQFDDGKQRQYHTGDVVVEAVDTWHFGFNNGTVPVRLLVIDQVEQGDASTILAK